MVLRDLAMKTVRAVVDACSRDPELRSRVMADPKAALAEEGVELPFEKVEAVEDTPETTHVALTDPNAELSDEQMETVVGGISHAALLESISMMDTHRRQAAALGFRTD